MDDQTSVYSFTSYNTSHYSSNDLTNRLQQKVNSYAIEMNQKVRADNDSLCDMEEGMNALSNFLNGVEEKRPSVTELIGSRINLDDCLKLKLDIREKIRQTKKIRTDLFTSATASSTAVAMTDSTILVGMLSKVKSETPAVLTPQTSRVSTPGIQHSSPREVLHLAPPKIRKPKPKSIVTSKSFSSLSPSPPITPILPTPLTRTVSKAETVQTPSTNPSPSLQEWPQEKRTSHTNSNEISNEKRYSQSNDSLSPVQMKQPLVTQLIPSSSQRSHKSLMPSDDLADRQLAWLLNIEAKNRQAKQAMEARITRELKVVPDISKAQQSWVRVKKIHKKKYGMEVRSRSRGGGDLESIDENDSTFSAGSISSSLSSMNTLLAQFYQQGDSSRSTGHQGKSKKSKQKIRSETNQQTLTRGGVGGVALEPLANPLPRIADSTSSVTPLGFKKILPSDSELFTFRLGDEEGEERREEVSGRRPSSGAASLSSTLMREGVVDCETPRVMTWTDLAYDPTEYSLQTTQLEPIFLGPLSAYQTKQLQEEGGEEDDDDDSHVIATSRSDQSDYEAEWDRASRKLR